VRKELWSADGKKSGHLEDKVRDGKVVLEMLPKQVVRMEGEWNWRRIVFNGRLWY